MSRTESKRSPKIMNLTELQSNFAHLSQRLQTVQDCLYPEALVQHGWEWQTLLEDIGSAIELLQAADDEALQIEAVSNINQLTQELDQWRFWHPYDKADAQVTITATSGGEDVYAWVVRLARMYTQWADRQDYRVKELEVRDWEGGAKPMTIAITDKGDVYGSLKQEVGVHQMTAIPLFETKGSLRVSPTPRKFDDHYISRSLCDSSAYRSMLHPDRRFRR
jgi:protein subunit release factor A